ncbi:hypothetical protein QQ054_30315 [Oscillatoria amoena NRMC-F 0135]|nr:hypothetical protein [Oscillatoria amoena NRMC-F 0135]
MFAGFCFLLIAGCSESPDAPKETPGQKLDRLLESKKKKLNEAVEKTKTELVDGARQKVDDAYKSTQEYLDRGASNLRKDSAIEEATGENEQKAPPNEAAKPGVIDNLKGADRTNFD